MARYRMTLVAPGDPVETFEYLARFSNASEWDPGVDAAVALQDGPAELGHSYRLMVRAGSRTFPLVYRVASIDRPHRVELVGENSFVRSRDVIEVWPTKTGCRVAYDAELSPKGILALAGPLIAAGFSRIGARAEAGLAAKLGA